MNGSASRLFGLIAGGVFLLSLATLPGHLYSVDGLAYYRSATTLAWQGSLLLDPPLVWGTATSAPVWPIGYSLVLAPVAAVLSPLRELQPAFDIARPTDLGLLYDDPIYGLMSWVNGLIVALTAGASFLLARQVGLSSRISLLAALTGTLASPLFFYGHADFAQPLTALLLVVGTLFTLRARLASSRWEGILLVPIAALAVLARPLDGVLGCAVWALVAAWPTVPATELEGDQTLSPADAALRRRLIVVLSVAIGVAAGFAVNLFVNEVRRGDALDFGYRLSSTLDPIATALAYAVSPGRGLPWHFPLLLLVPVGLVVMLRARRHVELVALLLPALLFGGLYLFWGSLGDVSYGPRFLVPIIPLLAVVASAALLSGWRYARVSFGILAILGVAANFSLLFADQLLYWFNRGSNPVGSTGFWQQFEPGAFAPIGSLRSYHPTGLGNLADVVWLRLSHATSGVSLVIAALMAAAGVFLLWRAWRATSVSPGQISSRVQKVPRDRALPG